MWAQCSLPTAPATQTLSLIHVLPLLFTVRQLFRQYLATTPALLVSFPRFPIQGVGFIYFAALVLGLFKFNLHNLFPRFNVKHVKVWSFVFLLPFEVNKNQNITLFR